VTDPRPLPILRSKRVYLRAPERDDIDLFVRWFSDAEVIRFLTARIPMARASEEGWFERMIEAQGKDHFFFVIAQRSDDRAIGNCALFDVSGFDGKAEVGITIGEKALWSTGLGTEALEALVDFAFGSLRLERVALSLYDYNPRARRSYEKAGFTLEGTLRRAHFRDGEYHDILVMSILRDEWRSLERPRAWELP
jgi:RimJ/RimL family protein N-acetyltransferase